MGTILRFVDSRRSARDPERRGRHGRTGPCDIVIFPGVRVERQEVDLGHRLRDTAGRGHFDDIGGRRPRKTS